MGGIKEGGRVKILPRGASKYTPPLLKMPSAQKWGEGGGVYNFSQAFPGGDPMLCDPTELVDERASKSKLRPNDIHQESGESSFERLVACLAAAHR